MGEIFAAVRPLHGKHYGTDVAVTIGNRVYDINVWIPLGAPSDEDLADWGVTTEQWLLNVEVDDGWDGTEPIQNMHPSDNHYQSAIELAVAKRIAEALNGILL